MFRKDKFYIVVGKDKLIIKKEGDNLENIIDFSSITHKVPNVPFYYYLFDEGKIEINNAKTEIKNLKIRNATIFLPDDCMELEVDKKILTEFFMLCGVKKIEIKFQGLFMSSEDKKYISIAKTSRAIALQYIVNEKLIAIKYLDNCNMDKEKIKLEVSNIHYECEYENIPIYINNINQDMEEFNDIGALISLKDIVNNISIIHAEKL